MVPTTLHIGTHKTGSTHLQEWLIQNREGLSRVGLNTARKVVHFHRLAAESLELAATGRTRALPFLDENLDDILDGLRSTTKTNAPRAVVSSEYYWNSDPREVRRFYESSGLRIDKVICFVRRQDGLLASSYNQAVKVLGRETPFSAPKGYFEPLDWARLYDRWSAAFPDAEISLHGYDYHRHNGTVLSVFKSDILGGLQIGGEVVPTEAQSNFSLDAELLEISRIANVRGHLHLPDILAKEQSRLGYSPRFEPDPAEAEAIEHLYICSNEKLAQRLKRPDIEYIAVPGWARDTTVKTQDVPTERVIKVLEHFSDLLGRSHARAIGARSIPEHLAELGRIAAGPSSANLSTLIDAAAESDLFDQPSAEGQSGFDIGLAVDLLAFATSLTHPTGARRQATPSKTHVPANDIVRADRDGQPRSDSAPPKKQMPSGGRLREWLLGLRHLGFDRYFYLARNRDVASSGMDPLLHYHLHGQREGRAKRGEKNFLAYMLPRLHLRAKHMGFDDSYYLAANPDVTTSGLDPLFHFDRHGKFEGRRRREPKAFRRFAQNLYLRLLHMDFDEKFYIDRYPDLARVSDPLLHFHKHGRFEGRQKCAHKDAPSARPPNGFRFVKQVAPDPDKPTILVVVHEGSRTGAPIIGYNLIAGLATTYNVVTLFLEPGPVVHACAELGVTTATFQRRCREWSAAGHLVAKLCRENRFKFAIVNSIEARFVLRELARRKLPTVTLVHEFASYIRPVGEFAEALAISTEVIFPAKIVRDDALRCYPELSSRSFAVLPQGLCQLPPAPVAKGAPSFDDKASFEKLEIWRREGDAIIAGIGYVSYRKGVDLFIQCAERLIKNYPEKSLRFVWIGDNYRPDTDTAYSAFLADQVERSSVGERIAFLGEVQDMATVYESVDILLLTSRLDPFPNVTIEALSAGVPTICFEGASGTVETLNATGCGTACVARFLDVDDMVEKAGKLLTSDTAMQNVGEALRRSTKSLFSMERYVQEVENVALRAVEQTRHLKQSPR